MATVAEIFGSSLRRIRMQRGITQKRLGAIAGMSHTFIGEMERGLKAPNLNAVIVLAEALNAGVEELMAGFIRKPVAPRQQGEAIAAARWKTTRIGARFRKRR